MSYTKMDLSDSYVNMDDWSDIRYISENIPTSTSRFKFFVKNSSLRKNLIVQIETLNRDMKEFVLYNDIFSLKRKNKIKDKIINIVNQVEYQQLNNLIGSEASRLLKLKNTKSKI
ncbi:MAG: hypothetical protein ACOC3Z_03310 [Nanoarchaeota archaeon]